MEMFGYLSVFYSIILGLAVTRVFSGFAELINLRQRVRWYGPFIIWGIFLLFFSAWEWWVVFRWHTHSGWSFPLYAFLAIRPSLIYFAAHLLLPSFDNDERVVTMAAVGFVFRSEWLQWLLPLLQLGALAYFTLTSSPSQ